MYRQVFSFICEEFLDFIMATKDKKYINCAHNAVVSIQQTGI